MNFAYAELCPACGEDLSWEEVKIGRCLNKNVPLCSVEIGEFEEFFEKCVGRLRAIQKAWALRIFRGESFAITAPTGIGKTTFGLAMALFLSLKGEKCYIIFPTSLLVSQAVKILNSFSEKLGLKLGFNSVDEISVGFYYTGVKKEEFIQNLESYRIIITTAQFLAKFFDNINDMRFDFIFVDDVDAVLKASKNVERILQILGVFEGKKSKLVVSTATAKIGKKAELFRKHLNFSIGSSQFNVRNIEDYVKLSGNLEDLMEVMERLGAGGIVYCTNTKKAEEVYSKLKEKFKVGIVSAKSAKDFELFVRGELDYLIGTSYYYGALVRGLDLPERIKYAVFFGCPVFKVGIEDIDSASPNILRIIAFLYKDHEEIKPFLGKFRRIEKIADELRQVLKKLMEKEEIKVRDAVVRKGEIIFPDVRTYIQASGRTSRLHAGGITKGASFVFESNEEILKVFIERAKLFDIEFKSFDNLDFERLKKELEESRKRFKKAEDIIKPVLFVVESPTKARQISRFFGRPSVRMLNGAFVYEVPTEKYLLLVTSTLGHLADLVTYRGFHGVEIETFSPIYTTIKKCRSCGYQFTEKVEKCPRCGGEIDDAFNRLSALRKLAKEVEFTILGTDPDSEGEKIAWDVRNLLAGCNVKRAEFHEVTRRAIVKALENLRDINENLVKAQIVRRIEDRWIGFTLSQELQRVFNNRNLSAGRAQTPVLGWIIESYMNSRKKRKIAIVKELDLALETDSKEFEIEIELLEERKELLKPLPPYTTNTLLSDANRILKLSARETMRLAQDLFENGLITYHRTDSTRVSDVGRSIAKEYLAEDFFGREWFMEGAHECIRPTRAIDRETLERLVFEGLLDLDLRRQHFSLYDLIFRRFMASQCKEFEAKIKKYKISFDGKSIEEERIVEAKGRAYELYKSVWVRKELSVGKFDVKAEVRTIPAAPLLSESDVIRLMKERGIGRPSTYATILDKLFMRGYVFEKNGKLIPSKDLGIRIYEYLMSKYRDFLSEQRTRALEEKMDAIEQGRLDYLEALKDLYDEITKAVSF